MRVLYQPTQSTPGDWVGTDSRRWAGLGSIKCHAVNVQGNVFEGADHYAVRELSGGAVQVAVWHDDPADWPIGTRWARVVTTRSLASDSRPEYGGAFNTHCTQDIYADDEAMFRRIYADNDRVTVHPWSDFDPRWPAPLDGQWVTDPAHEAHQGSRSVRGWREWTEGLDPSELDSAGYLKQQRAQGRFLKPSGTRTYFHNASGVAEVAVHAVPGTKENILGLTASGASVQGSGNVGTAGTLVWCATTPANEPNSAAWPTTGVYRYQLDVVTAGADLAFGLLTLGAGAGHFARVDSGVTADQQTFVQDQSSFSLSGLHLASVTNPAWSAGAAGDRFEVAVACQKVIGHGNQTMDMQLGETDDFADGPWAAAVARRIFIT